MAEAIVCSKSWGSYSFWVSRAKSYSAYITNNQPHINDNERTTFVVCELFLVLNGMILTADDAECVLTMLALAAGELPAEAFAGWDHPILR